MLVIIQARTNSKRFPKKALYKIKSVPLIIRVIRRVLKSKLVSRVIVSTSKNKSDDLLVNLIKKYKYNSFRGNLNNVALRMLQTAQSNKVKYFIRINGDSPLIDYRIINYAIKIHKKYKNADLVTNVFPRNYPSGQSVEILKTKILLNNISYFNKDQKEHVTSYFYSNNSKFKIINFKKNFKRYKNLPKLSIDYKSELKKINKYFND